MSNFKACVFQANYVNELAVVTGEEKCDTSGLKQEKPKEIKQNFRNFHRVGASQA